VHARGTVSRACTCGIFSLKSTPYECSEESTIHHLQSTVRRAGAR
jgi:hypothetical protein